MKGITRRFVSVVMVFTLVFAVFQGTVMANYQNPVQNISARFMRNTLNSYDINLSWSKPSTSTKDPGGSPDSDVAHEPEGYDLSYRNTSTGGGSQPLTNSNADPKSTTIDLTGLTLDQGSLYEFRALPYHVHVTPAAGTTPERKVRALIDTAIEEYRALFMTNIKVEAEGIGNKLAITWDNPRFDGNDFFTHYHITFGSTSSSSGTAILGDKQIPIDSPDLVRLPNNRLQYSYVSDSLQVGSIYWVTVEPQRNPANTADDIRGRRPEDITTVSGTNNVKYKLFFPTKAEVPYKADGVMIKQHLQALPDGGDYVRLVWGSLANSDVLKNNKVIGAKLEVFMADDEAMSVNRVLIGTLSGENIRTINFWRTARPKDSIVYYQIKLSYTLDGQLVENVSNVASFDPIYSDFEPYRPTIYPPITDNAKKPLSMTVDFEAFARPSYNADEIPDPKYDNLYIDKNIEYSFYVTDALKNLDSTLIKPVLIAPGTNFTEVKKDNKPIYTTNLTQYSYYDEAAGTFDTIPLDDNKVYYIKIIATRVQPSGVIQFSQPAYGSHFIAPIGPVPTNPLMMTRPPLRIKKDANGIEVITENSITIQWATKYFEVYNEADKAWYAKLGVQDGTIYFGPSANDLPESQVLYLNEYKTEAAVRSALTALGANDAGILPVRFTDISGSQYELHTITYEAMEELGGYDIYAAFLNDPESQDMWTEIKPAGKEPDLEFEVTLEDVPTTGDMTPNTPYVIFFRPFTVDTSSGATKRNAAYPTFVIGTTLKPREPIVVTPTVPVVIPVDSTDMTVTVKWEYNPNLNYELRYSDIATDYPEGGTAIAPEDIKATAEIKKEDGKEYIYYTIKNLFPDNTYYIWVRASNIPEEGSNTPVLVSAWSNPVTQKTKDIAPPDPPKGLGLASKEHVDMYNKLASVKLLPIDKDYAILEWMRNYADTGEVKAAQGGAGGNTPTDAAQLLLPEVPNMYLALFSNLIPNKTYYVRARTFLTVTKNKGQGQNTSSGIEAQYSYQIQLSEYEDFTDAKEIYVPPLEDLETLDPIYTKRKESVWGTTISIYTSKYEGEYDGKETPDQYPLPPEDFEIIFNAQTNTLTYRFRTNQKDATGANDNNVDQRFISKLVAQRVYTYTVDLSKYNNNTVSNRVVELPYSIVKAFDERKISLKLVADNVSVTFGPGSLETNAVKSSSDFGRSASFKLTMSANPSSVPALDYGDVYASQPQKLTAQMVSANRTINVDQFAKPVQMTMKANDRTQMTEANTNMFIAHSNTVGWENVKANYDKASGAFTAQIIRSANYAVVSKTVSKPEAPTDLANLTAEGLLDANDIRDAISNVTSKINITDQKRIDASATITANQLNQLMAAVAYKRKQIAINESMSDKDYQSLGKAKMLVTGAELTREQGIDALVKLYEQRTKTVIKGVPTLNESYFTDIKNASAQYQKNLLKADEIGFFSENVQKVNPKGKFSMGDAMYMLNIIIEDAGM